MSRVWLPVSDEPAWVTATVESRLDDSITLRREQAPPAGIEPKVTVSHAEFSAFPVAETSVEVVDDLTKLSDVCEATMLDTLRRRYAVDDIYTAIGPVVIAMNPYRAVASCTSEAIEKLVEAEAAASEHASMPPHAFSVAAAAFEQLRTAKQAQSILISGESGAGKTETNKICLSCLAELSLSSGKATEACLEAGLVLESFGNAKTVYNDNSSRFGKWCAVQFGKTFQIHSCSIAFYLLELSRITNTPAGERSYHVFYQMLAGASADQRRAFGLLGAVADYSYTAEGVATVDRVDDAHEWKATNDRLELLEVSGERRAAMFQLFSAVLATGNLRFAPGEANGGDAPQLTIVEDGSLARVAPLLGLTADMLETKLTTRIVSSGRGNSSYTVALTEAQCCDTRDALAKAVYVALFEWLVARLNDAQRPLDGSDKPDEECFVGLLDIFGFENFAQNGFEQLCINFTNERLQSHFMDALVRLQMEEYKREGIECQHITFPDNAKQIELLDHKSRGVYAMLDDECNVPGGSDLGFVNKLHSALLSKNTLYDKPKRAGKGANVGQTSGVALISHGAELDALSFVVVHYAGPVLYTAVDWLEKNRGRLSADLVFALSQSSVPLCAELFPVAPAAAATPAAATNGKKEGGKKDSKKASVGMTFRRSLRDLSTTMMQTHQQYIRCIKPNGLRKADAPDGHFILRQLRYTGVAAVVQIQRSGYPISLAHAECLRRYRCIAFEQAELFSKSRGSKESVEGLMRAGPTICNVKADWLLSRDVQVGVSRVYMREVVMRQLEVPRRQATEKAARCVQRLYRGHIARRAAAHCYKHRKGAAAVRQAMTQQDLAGAGEALDALLHLWEESRLTASYSVLLPPRQAELGVLEMELSALEHGLAAEDGALTELLAAIHAASQSAGSKEGYVALKVALQSAQAVDRGLRPALGKALDEARDALARMLSELGISAEAATAVQQSLKSASTRMLASTRMRSPSMAETASAEAAAAAAMATTAAAAAASDPAAAEAAAQAATLAEWEAEVKKQAGEREAARRAKQLALEESLITNSEVTFLTVTMRTSALAGGFLGYSEAASGVSFSDENNAVVMIAAGGVAQTDNELQIGDVVLGVDGEKLQGGKVVEVLLRNPRKTYKLAIARSSALSGANIFGRGGECEHEGWVMVEKARQGHAINLLERPRKCWSAVSGGALQVYDGAKRAGKKPKEYALKNATCRTPLRMLAGKELQHSPVIATFLTQRRFPFTVAWPLGEVEYDLILASMTSEDTAKWVKAINRVVKGLKEESPTSGWLIKEGGRKHKKGLLNSLFRSAKRRWFVLSPPSVKAPTLLYYPSPIIKKSTALGSIALNEHTQVSASEEAPNPFSFCITSQGPEERAPITTMLAASSVEELTRWMKALSAAINIVGGERPNMEQMHRRFSTQARMSLTRGSSSHSNNLRQSYAKNKAQSSLDMMASLEQPELLKLRESQLRKLAEHVDIVYDFAGYKHKRDHELVVDLILARTGKGVDMHLGQRF